MLLPPAPVLGVETHVVCYVLRDQGTVPPLSLGEEIRVGRPAKVRFFLYREGIMPSVAQLLGKDRRIVFVEEKLQRSISCRRRNASSASSA